MDKRNSIDNGFWVFGYGSLCWHPGFSYTRSMTGYVKDFSRRFWQGNITHRGTVEKPARVATLIEDKGGVVYGRAFQVQDQAALTYLENRECALGGYITAISTFHSRDGINRFPVVIYIATDKSEHWLGEASLQVITSQIIECSGPSGHNAEYLLRLAEFMHRYLPDAHDEHLFMLEMLIRFRIKEENICLITLMGNRDFVIDLDEDTTGSAAGIRVMEDQADVNERRRENHSQFSARIPSKTLRCVKM